MIDPDTGLLQEIMPALQQLGFEISELKKNTFVVHAVPAELAGHESVQDLIEGMMEQYKKNRIELKNDHQTNLARSLAKKLSLKPAKAMGEAEMSAFADALFACQIPYQSPAGKPIISILSLEELSEKLK
jgi:DNA mismatch repair protein MutL